MALADRAELAVRLTLDDRQFSGGLRRAQGTLGGFARNAGRVGKGVGQIGTAFARAGLIAGGAAIGGLTAVAKAAIDFEDAFAGVRKTVDETDLFEVGSSFEGLRQQILTMSTGIPIAATELARLGEVAGALGVKADSIDEFIRTTALLGVTTDLTSDQAAEALGKVGTILGLTGKDYEHFADVLVNLGNQGASTESEILEMSKRFAASGKQAGLSAEDILALASAAASLGIEPEAGGGALSRIFANMATEIANASDKGKAFAEITGDSIKELQARIDKGDALGIFTEMLEGLRGLSRTEAAQALKDLGITDTRNRNAIVAMAGSLGFVNDQLRISREETKALSEEAAKRFDTVRSKLELVRNNALRVAIAMGDEFIPAIGRAAERLVEFLQRPDVLEAARNFGKDVGKFIDGIDWDKVADGAMQIKTALQGAASFALTLFRAFDALPTEIKGALIGGVAVNKLSGGLLGAGIQNIAGGLVGGFATALTKAGIGKFFVQPVFVTNPGFGGGVGGGLAKAGGIGLAGVAVSGAALVGALVAVQKLVNEPKLQQEAGENIAGVEAIIARGNANEMAKALAGLQALPSTLDPLQRILYDLDANGVRTHTESLVGALQQALATAPASTPASRPSYAYPKTEGDMEILAASQKEQAKLAAIKVAQAAMQATTSRKLEAVRAAQAAARVALSAKIEASKQTSIANKNAIVGAIVNSVPTILNFVNISGIGQAVVKTGQTLQEGNRKAGLTKAKAGGF